MARLNLDFARWMPGDFLRRSRPPQPPPSHSLVDTVVRQSHAGPVADQVVVKGVGTHDVVLSATIDLVERKGEGMYALGPGSTTADGSIILLHTRGEAQESSSRATTPASHSCNGPQVTAQGPNDDDHAQQASHGARTCVPEMLPPPSIRMWGPSLVESMLASPAIRMLRESRPTSAWYSAPLGASRDGRIGAVPAWQTHTGPLVLADRPESTTRHPQ